MKTGFTKFMKGMLAILVIKLFFFGGAFFIQSCQKSEIFSSKEEALSKTNFLNSANTSIHSLNNVKLIFNKSLKSKSSSTKFMGEEIATITIYSTPHTPINTNQSLENASSLKDLATISKIDLGVSYEDGSSSDNIFESQKPIASYQISVEEAKEALRVTLSEGKNYLYSKGFTDSDILNLLAADLDGPAMSESDLIPVVMMLIANEQESSNQLTSIDFLRFLSAPVYASKIGSCAGDALGISAIAAVISEGLRTKAGKALLKKVIRKVASRALGWVGAAIFVYEFGDCMGWWQVVGFSSDTNLSCKEDLLSVRLNNSDKIHLITRKSINYVSQNNYYVQPTKQIQTYSINFNSVSKENLDEQSECSVKKKSIIISNYIDQMTIKEYDPYDLVLDF